MALTQLSYNSQLTLALSLSNTFGQQTQGPITESFSLPSTISLTAWTQAFVEQYVIAASGFQEFDLTTFTSLLNESISGMGHVLKIYVLPVDTTAGVSGGICNLTPGSSNGLTWFFTGTTPGINVPVNGEFTLTDDPAGAGQALSGTSKTLRITNTGTQSITVTVVAIVGP